MYSSSFNDFTIEITNEHEYSANSADNRTQYDLVYRHPEDAIYSPTSVYGIKVYKSGLYKTAVVMASGGATQVGPDSAIIYGQDLVFTCCDKVFSLQLPDLALNWMVAADMATCFSVHLYQDSYIIHGELAISRLDRSGNIIWQFGARDIFVNIGPSFQMHDEYIEVMDWEGYRYKLFYDGTAVDDGMAPLSRK